MYRLFENRRNEWINWQTYTGLFDCDTYCFSPWLEFHLRFHSHFVISSSTYHRALCLWWYLKLREITSRRFVSHCIDLEYRKFQGLSPAWEIHIRCYCPLLSILMPFRSPFLPPAAPSWYGLTTWLSRHWKCFPFFSIWKGFLYHVQYVSSRPL